MTEEVPSRFRKEIANFYLISLVNLVFAAIAMAFGIQYIVSAVSGRIPEVGLPGLRIFIGAVAMAGFGLGLSWLLTTVRIFEGIEEIRDTLSESGDTITEDRITCLIVRMLAHYRDNRDTIQRMILVCTLGGVCFFILGISDGLELARFTGSGAEFTFSSLLLIPAMLLVFGISATSLISSYYFLKFSRTWDRRLDEIGQSECALKQKLGLDEA